MISHAHLIVGRGTGDRAGFDAESLAQQLHAAPRCDRIVRRQHHGGQRGFDVGLTQNGFHAVGPQQAIAQFEHDASGGPDAISVSMVRVRAGPHFAVVVTIPRSVKIMVRRAPESSKARCRAAGKRRWL